MTKPVDAELFKRTAPQWNCVDFPDGPHYTPGTDSCLWCGKTRNQIVLGEPQCNGKPDCEAHPHLRLNHPSKPVEVVTDSGVAMVDYSDAWERAEAEWERLSSTPEGRAWLSSLVVEGP